MTTSNSALILWISSLSSVPAINFRQRRSRSYLGSQAVHGPPNSSIRSLSAWDSSARSRSRFASVGGCKGTTGRSHRCRSTAPEIAKARNHTPGSFNDEAAN